jgi:hypothetical protein
MIDMVSTQLPVAGLDTLQDTLHRCDGNVSLCNNWKSQDFVMHRFHTPVGPRFRVSNVFVWTSSSLGLIIGRHQPWPFAAPPRSRVGQPSPSQRACNGRGEKSRHVECDWVEAVGASTSKQKGEVHAHREGQ